MFLIVLPDTSTENSLLFRLQSGDDDAVMAVYEEYFSPLFHYTRLKTGDPALAEDIVSEVFVRLIRALGTKSAPHSHLRGWLFRVARNEIATHYQKADKVNIIHLEEWMPAPSETNPETHIGDLMEIHRMRHAIRMLNDEQQEVLILRFGQRLSLKETADIMDKSVSAIKSLQFRAVDTLRGILLQPGREASNG